MSELQTALNSVISQVHETSQSAEPRTQIPSISKVKVSRDNSGRITVAFPYNPLLVEKVKTIENYKWHPDKKHWSFPDSEGILHKILKVFGQKQVHLDPSLASKSIPYNS